EGNPAGAHRAEQKAPLPVGGRAPETEEGGIECQGGAWVGGTAISARGVRLPDLQQRIGERRAPLIEHLTADLDALTERGERPGLSARLAQLIVTLRDEVEPRTQIRGTREVRAAL